MGVLNLSQPNATRQHSGGALLGVLSQFLHPFIQDKLKEEGDTQAATGLENMLNQPREVETASPADIETQSAQAKMAAQQTGIGASQTTPLTDLLTKPQASTPDVAPELGKMLTPAPLQSTSADVMPEAKTAMVKPVPGDTDYRPVPRGMSAADYGSMAKTEMAPTLNRELAKQVQLGNMTIEQAYAAMKQSKPAIQLVKNAEGRMVGVEKKLGDTGVTGYSSAGNSMTPTTIFVKGLRDENPKITDKEISDRLTAHQLETGRPAKTVDWKTGLTFDRRNGVITDSNGQQISTQEAQRRGVDVKQLQAEAAQRGGSVAANYNTANDLYQKNLPAAIDLRHKVAMKDLLPDSKFKSINEIKQWALQETSDPDLNELKGKLMLMADNLQRTIGGTQGGEWAYKVAATLLDPSLNSEAFERRMNSHGADIAMLAKSRRQFGTNEVSTPETGTQVREQTLPATRQTPATNAAQPTKTIQGTTFVPAF